MGEAGESVGLIEGACKDAACLGQEGEVLPGGLLAAQVLLFGLVGRRQLGGAGQHPLLQLGV